MDLARVVPIGAGSGIGVRIEGRFWSRSGARLPRAEIGWPIVVPGSMAETLHLLPLHLSTQTPTTFTREGRLFVSLASSDIALRLIGGARDAWQQVVSQELRQTSEAAALLRGLTSLKDIIPLPGGPIACREPYHVESSSGVHHGSYPPGDIAVGRRLEGMDNTMASLTAETKSICLDIAGFQSRMMGLEQRVTMVEAQAANSRD
ncbi:hypothetical protein NDU88_007790 [Pleurodeles waltl]|uniref:Uncharacterized protein n=1 Tax=Pleurodeles waltl TaxID=8319 RepID=A0AAV7N594_PLEWA|nr:hypothetical protein NDU88_007790 [Pleurodeles waltl]